MSNREQKTGARFENVELTRAADMVVAFQRQIKEKKFSNNPETRKKEIETLLGIFDKLAWSLFPTELGHFTIPGQKTISSKYKDASVELSRTLRSLVAIAVLVPMTEGETEVTVEGPNYQMFTYLQKEQGKLTVEGFNQLRKMLFAACPDKESTVALLTVLSMHDTPKLLTVKKRIEEVCQIASINHDVLLNKMVQVPRLVKELAPSLERLTPELRELAIKTMNNPFNRGQVAQAEATAAHLLSVAGQNSTQREVDFQRGESTGDLAGVTGTLGQIYNEKVHRAYLLADQVVDAMREGRLTIKEAYLTFLQERANLLKLNLHFNEEDFVSPEGKEKITLMRFACLLRIEDPKEYEILESVFRLLSQGPKSELVEMFGRSGLDGKMAALFYYAPALMCETRDLEVEDDPIGGRRFGIEKGLRLMARICKAGREYLEGKDLDETPLYYQRGTGQEVNFDDVMGIRGATASPDMIIREFVFGMDLIVRDIERGIDLEEISGDEALVVITDQRKKKK